MLTPVAIRRRRVPGRLRAAARNALEIARLGRLGEQYSAPFDIVDRGPIHRVRRYATLDANVRPADTSAALLIPPLMVTSDVYDIAPDVSAVAALGARGVRPYVLDFGAPEDEEGGMRRTLDDHVRAVVAAVRRVRALEGQDIHIAGYSQGGMFAYQGAAFLRGEGIRSVITFGSPVDIHRGLPAVSRDVTAALVRAVEPAFTAIMSRVEGLPGRLTSTAFKLVSTRKEITQRIDFLRMLHDRNAIVRQEARRQFLGGGGFVAWPGPAFRTFVDEFVVHNRMLAGGFVIDGKTVSLSDLSCPILAFIGETDEIARPPTIRAIVDAAPDAKVTFASVRAGHFGIVVGSRAMQLTWPAVAGWVKHHDGRGPMPEVLRPRPHHPEIVLDDDLEAADFDVEVELFVDAATRGVKRAWNRLGSAISSASDAADAVRYQEPRLRFLARLEPDTLVSPARALAHRAEESGDSTFFLFRGRAFTYEQANTRVTNVTKGLWRCGVRPGQRVGVVMAPRPSLLSTTTALSRLGAVSVVTPPDASASALSEAFERLGVRVIITDPERAEACLASGLEVLVLGGGRHRDVPRAATDMEEIDPDEVMVPAGVTFDSGRARDLAHLLLRPSSDGSLRAAPVTNGRWALSAYGAAAACTLSPNDTVFCGVPLHHPTGLLVSVGAALVGGARLALGRVVDGKQLTTDVRRSGATIVFYAGEMLRVLLDVPPSHADRTLPVRLVAGSGMRPALAARLSERFGFGVMEFYAGTSHRAILANASGEKPGALGRVLPGSADVEVVRWDFAAGTAARDERGRLVIASEDEPGVIAARVTSDELVVQGADGHALEHGAFDPDDTWTITQDVVRRDADGDHWFVDALGGFVQRDGEPVSTRAVEDALYATPEVRLAAAHVDDRGRLVAAFEARSPLRDERLWQVLSALAPEARPDVVTQVATMPLTDGFRPDRRALSQLKAVASWERRAGAYVAIAGDGAARATP
jgi:putative long chain acyl-CoA synthase